MKSADTLIRVKAAYVQSALRRSAEVPFVSPPARLLLSLIENPRTHAGRSCHVTTQPPLPCKRLIALNASSNRAGTTRPAHPTKITTRLRL